jgi:hypothetical protein
MRMTVACGRISAHHVDVAASGNIPQMRAFPAREHDGKRLIVVGAVATLEFHCVHGTAPNGIRHMRLVSIGGFRGG